MVCCMTNRLKKLSKIVPECLVSIEIANAPCRIPVTKKGDPTIPCTEAITLPELSV